MKRGLQLETEVIERSEGYHEKRELSRKPKHIMKAKARRRNLGSLQKCPLIMAYLIRRVGYWCNRI